MSRLERAVGNAVSFPGSSPPEQCRMIGMVEHETMGNVLYYESMTGGTVLLHNRKRAAICPENGENCKTAEKTKK